MLVVGNVVLDRTRDGFVPGGPSLYTARMAKALGADVTLVTTLAPDYPRWALEGMDVRSVPARETCTYANQYSEEGDRRQMLLATGEDIPEDLIPNRPFDAVVYAPAFHEYSWPPIASGGCVSVALQGILRDREGEMVVAREDWWAIDPFDGADLAFLSEEDTREPAWVAQQFASRGPAVVLTRGWRGATLFLGDVVRNYSAVEARLTEPTGAGDCFMAAFVVRHRETGGDIDQAMRFALAAGALAVEGSGWDTIPTRASVEQRAREVAA